MTNKLVLIPVEGPIQEIAEDNMEVALRRGNAFLGNVITDHFHGEYAGERGLFFVDDLGRGPVNPRATEAYWKCCHPGTSHQIRGGAFGLFGQLAE